MMSHFGSMDNYKGDGLCITFLFKGYISGKGNNLKMTEKRQGA